jgi:hypothetical protein
MDMIDLTLVQQSALENRIAVGNAPSKQSTSLGEERDRFIGYHLMVAGDRCIVN